MVCLSGFLKADAQTTFTPVGGEWWYNYYWQDNPLSNSTTYPNLAKESTTITLEQPDTAEVSVRFIDQIGKNVQQV